MGLKEVCAQIKKSKSFLITTHTNPEGDALGSELAFFRLVRRLGKRAVIVNEENIPYGYEFLPGVHSIIKYKPKNDISFDCFVALDCSGLARCAGVSRLNTKKCPIINIDHHISNERFGDVNLVEPDASSASQLVYEIYKALKVSLDADSALYLYTGIFTDTGSFRYSNTNAYVHKIVSELLRYKIDVSQVYKNIYGSIPRQDIQVLVRILPGMKFEAAGRVVWFAVPGSLLRGKKINFDLTENILSFGRAVKDVEVAVLFKENLGEKKEIRVNFRSEGKVDVNKIARYFGGGGHHNASACTINGRLDDIRKRVLRKILAEL
ncbi:MAG: bifunctional oligoribonuclease/PAP phosphatase NrnA [Candidatus Omnitrophota bacterium]